MLLEDSTTYQEAVQKGVRKGRIKGKIEGKIEGQRKVLLQLATERFGQPNRKIAAALQAIDDSERLDQLVARLLHVESWKELLAGA